jgi:hypothetical protein
MLRLSSELKSEITNLATNDPRLGQWLPQPLATACTRYLLPQADSTSRHCSQLPAGEKAVIAKCWVLSAECWVLATAYKRVLGADPVLTYASTAIRYCSLVSN